MVAIFAVLTFLFFILVDYLVLNIQGKLHPALPSLLTKAKRIGFRGIDVELPDNVYYSDWHTWVSKNKYGLAKVGVDDFILKALGPISVTNAAEPGNIVSAGDVIFEGKVNGSSIEFRSPIDGIVRFVNFGEKDNMIKKAYNDWQMSLIQTSYRENTGSLIPPEKAKFWIKGECRRLRRFLSGSLSAENPAGVTMYDGGKAVEGAAAYLSQRGIEEFNKQFLSTSRRIQNAERERNFI
jgi:glycine cleavage system H lipoate-binding protein